MPHIKNFQGVCELKNELKKAKLFATTSLIHFEDKKYQDKISDIFFNVCYFQHFFEAIPTSKKDLKKQIEVLESWIEATVYLIAAQRGLVFEPNLDIIYKPDNIVFVELFTTYQEYLLNRHPMLKRSKGEPMYKALIKDYKKELIMCEVYIQRFSENTDWVQRLLLPKYYSLEYKQNQRREKNE